MGLYEYSEYVKNQRITSYHPRYDHKSHPKRTWVVLASEGGIAHVILLLSAVSI
jgi:hypothetical protein